MGIGNRLFRKRETREERAVGRATEEDRRRTRAKFGAVLGALAFALVAGSVTLVPTSQAAFPGLNGKIAFASNRDGNYEIYSMNPDGSGPTNLTNNSATDFDPAWSADGAKIAFFSSRDQPNGEIYVMNADGSGVTRLTINTASDFQAAWSPDGTKIVFVSDRDQPGDCNFSGNCEIYVMNADGSGVTRLTNNPAVDAGPAWSPDGTKIAFDRGGGPSNPFGPHDIYVMNADGSGQTQLTNDGVINGLPAWSPDGAKIVFVGRAGVTNPEIFVMNADGSSKQRLTFTANFISDGDPAWSPDGTKIAFASDRDQPGNGEIYVMSADGSGVTRLTNNPAQDSGPDWQPLPKATFLVIDEDSIDNGNPPNFFSDTDVNDDIAALALRSELPFFNAHAGTTITLYTGQVGDEGWFAPKAIPAAWDDAGPVFGDGLRNYLGNPSQPFPHNVGPGLGTGSDPEALLDTIPDLTPLRATGLALLEGRRVCALVYDSDVSINYGPLTGSLKGATLGTVAFEVGSATPLTGFSSGSLPAVEIEILDAEKVCEGMLALFEDAPEPTSSSEPYDTGQ